MNYLELLPNKKVENLHIIERRIERKRNRQINRQQKEKADKKRNIFHKYLVL